MSDKDFIDIGDELVVRISGYPVGKAVVTDITDECVWVEYLDTDIILPLDVKDYDY
jgi:hypothetical protein